MEMTAELGAARSQNAVYELLRNQILTLELKPGEMLSENVLASQMGVGRPQVRDALAQLAEEGYVVVYPQRGTEVALIDIDRLTQAVHARVVLEQAVIRELCEKGLTAEQEKQLADVLEKQREAGAETLGLLMAEWQFHYLLSAFCGKQYIWELFRTMECDMLRTSGLRYSTFNYQVYMNSLTSWENTQVEERLMLDNIRRGESEAANLICANHFNAILWNATTLRGIYPRYFAG